MRELLEMALPYEDAGSAFDPEGICSLNNFLGRATAIAASLERGCQRLRLADLKGNVVQLPIMAGHSGKLAALGFEIGEEGAS